MSSLAIIPARGGSKRIKNKNIKDFLGKPILSYSIDAALQSGLFEEVMVSTDSDRIAEIAKESGANVPFRRSQENANDYATLADVMLEVIAQYKEQGKTFETICCILPTAPFFLEKKIQKAYHVLREKDFDTVFPIKAFSYPIQRSLQINDDKVKMVWPEHLNTRSQDLPQRYHDSGQFYWVKTEKFLQEKTLFGSNSGGIILSELEVQDIDTIDDWKMAELKYKLLKKQHNL